MSKGALLCVGHLRNYRETLESFMNNLVLPNRLDVFLFLKRNSACRVRLKGPGPQAFSDEDVHDEETYISERFGGRLAALEWCDDDAEFEPFAADINARQKALRSTLSVLFPNNRSINESVWQVDWVCRNAYAAQKFAPALSAYDWVLRFRIDAFVPALVDLQNLQVCDNRVYVVRDFSHSAKELFLCRPELFCEMSVEFARTYSAFFPRHSEFKDFLVPESQFGQFLRFKRVTTLDLGLDYGYMDGSSPNTTLVYTKSNGKLGDLNILTDFPSDLNMDIAMQALSKDKHVQFHPFIGGAVHERIVAKAAADVAAAASVSGTTQPALAPLYEILCYLFLTMFLISNWIWLSKARFTPNERISGRRPPSLG